MEFAVLQYVFIVSGQYAGRAARVFRNDGPIPGFPYLVNVMRGVVGFDSLWMSGDELTALPDGFVPWYDQGNVEPV